MMAFETLGDAHDAAILYRGDCCDDLRHEAMMLQELQLKLMVSFQAEAP